jgi:hypothetical protein
MTTPEQNDILVRMFISVGTSAADFDSLTSVLGELAHFEQTNAINLRNLDEDDIFNLRIRYTGVRTEIAEDIGVAVPEEKKHVMDVLGTTDLSIFNGPDDPIAIINQKLAGNKLTYRLPQDALPQLKNVVEKSRVLYRGLNNVKLYSVKSETLDIAQYYKKYLTISQSEVLQRIEYLKTTYQKILDSCLEPETMINIAVDALTRFNHLPFTLESKDPEELLQIVYYEQLAAEGTLNALQHKQGQAISENDIKDGIARILVKLKFG